MKQPRKSNVAAGLKAEKALQLRKLGWSYDDIAQQVGYANRGTAWHTVQKLLAKRQYEAVDELRQVEGERLDDLQRQFMLDAMRGKEKAAGVILRIMERRARLFGLDAQVDTTINVYQSPEWRETMALLFDTLSAYPDAHQAVIRRIEAERAKRRSA